MKKIPTIFKRDFSLPKNDPNRGKITKNWHPDCLRIRDGEGVATYKWDGTSVMFKSGLFYKRYDAKRGKTPPDDFIPCGEPDLVTGHNTGWIPVDPMDPSNVWHIEAYMKYNVQPDGTYELIGPKLQGNPHNVDHHMFKKHGEYVFHTFPMERTYESIQEFFNSTIPMEGVVFWIDGEPIAKIKSSDFGLKWK